MHRKFILASYLIVACSSMAQGICEDLFRPDGSYASDTSVITTQFFSIDNSIPSSVTSQILALDAVQHPPGVNSIKTALEQTLEEGVTYEVFEHRPSKLRLNKVEARYGEKTVAAIFLDLDVIPILIVDDGACFKS